MKGREATDVGEETTALIDASVSCETTIEYDNRIEDEVEVEPDEEEHEDIYTRTNWGEIEHQFARYERNYRARRIRELTLAPYRKKRTTHKEDSAAAEAAV